MPNDELIRLALENGADKAQVIPQSQIVISPVFREICESNGCGNYGKCWMCPPDVGDIDSMMAAVRRYPHGLLYQTIHEIEDSFDIEGMSASGYAHAAVSQKIQRALLPVLGDGILHLSCGGCRLCPVCAKREDKPCRHPEAALTSLECCGIDVYNTTKDTELKYINGADTVTFFGMVLFGCEENG